MPPTALKSRPSTLLSRWPATPQHDLVGWTAELTGMDSLDSLQLVSQAGLAPTGNVVDTNYTMVAKLPKNVLGGASTYDGVHQRLAEAGRAHVASR